MSMFGACLLESFALVKSECNGGDVLLSMASASSRNSLQELRLESVEAPDVDLHHIVPLPSLTKFRLQEGQQIPDGDILFRWRLKPLSNTSIDALGSLATLTSLTLEMLHVREDQTLRLHTAVQRLINLKDFLWFAYRTSRQ